ncbi:MAG: hypothetical protein IPL07_09610 [Acidimicrobiaceae bacterium]|nr:hypothetical protein [Acidimicrobiaceae bacterium]
MCDHDQHAQTGITQPVEADEPLAVDGAHGVAGQRPVDPCADLGEAARWQGQQLRPQRKPCAATAVKPRVRLPTTTMPDSAPESSLAISSAAP